MGHINNRLLLFLAAFSHLIFKISNAFFFLPFLQRLIDRQNRESVAGSVIQATGMVEFEDGLWIGNHLKA